MDNSIFRGTGVAMVTPFTANKEIDFDALKKLINYLCNEVDYLVVMGTTAESATLSTEEKIKIIEFTKEECAGRIPIVVGMGGNNTKNISDTIKKINWQGISAILSVTPYYNKPNQNALYEHYKYLSAEYPLPVILYNVPGRTGCNMLPETALKIAEDFPKYFAIKEASGNMEQIMSIIKNKKDNFLVISGDDGLSLPLIAAGADGVISVVANVLPALTTKMIRFALEGNFNEGKEIHYMLFNIIDLLFKEGNPVGAKAALNLLGIIDNNLRLPLIPASSNLNKAIKDELELILKK